MSKVEAAYRWAMAILSFPVKNRKEAKNMAMEAIAKFKKGKSSPEGDDLVEFLKTKCEFIGFTPHVAYIKENAKIEDELRAVWVHAFGQRTLLFKIKNSPCLITVNSNMNLNKSILVDIDANQEINIDDVLKVSGIVS